MKPIIWLVLGIFVSLPGITSAQQVTDAIELTRTVIQTERKVIVAKNMNLSSSESKAFWPIYNDYSVAMRKIDDRQNILILKYANAYNHDNLTNEIAGHILKEFLSIQETQTKLKGSYIRKFEAVLPTVKVARFFQIDNKMDVMIDYEMSRQIPLIYSSE